MENCFIFAWFYTKAKSIFMRNLPTIFLLSAYTLHIVLYTMFIHRIYVYLQAILNTLVSTQYSPLIVCILRCTHYLTLLTCMYLQLQYSRNIHNSKQNSCSICSFSQVKSAFYKHVQYVHCTVCSSSVTLRNPYYTGR